MLGVDPGTRVVGWAVVQQQGRSFRLVACGAIRARGETLEQRLAMIHAGLLDAARLHSAAEAAVEEVFAGKNMKSALAIGQGRGVALAALGTAGLTVSSYAAKVIKRAVTGNGSASKDQVARMVALQLGLARPPEPADITDACAVALTRLVRRVRD
ncbi:MAG: crossover junction endodeoxyribonuclease RuvC [Planctomycetes bacterium]|nr:crossover junction endodeoxyribonuclease RuvC [Planctomycetota bacterium]